MIRWFPLIIATALCVLAVGCAEERACGGACVSTKPSASRSAKIFATAQSWTRFAASMKSAAASASFDASEVRHDGEPA
jgi:hypothetical protein